MEGDGVMARNLYKRWTETHDEVLRRSYGTVSVDRIAGVLGRTEYAVHKHARVLGLASRRGPKDTAWTEAQVADLKRLYPSAPWAMLTGAIGKSKTAIQAKAKLMGIRRRRPREVTAPELDTIAALWGSCSASDIARRIGRDPSTVRSHAALMGLPPKSAAPRPVRAVADRKAG